jgi:hypothetical protein
VRKCLQSGQAKLTQIVHSILFTGMLTMLLLMTPNTMNILMEEFNMKVLSHTGGLYNILRYKTINRSPDDKITSKIPKDGANHKNMVKREYDKPPDDDNAPENKDEEEDVPKPSIADDGHEQIRERDDLHHQELRSSLTNTRQSSAKLEAVARQDELPILNVVVPKLTNLSSGHNMLASNFRHDEVLNKTPCDQLMVEEYSTRESTSKT